MITATAQIHRTPRVSEHVFVAPVVREMPRPAPEPRTWGSLW